MLLKRFVSLLLSVNLVLATLFTCFMINVSAQQITIANIFGTNVNVRSSMSTTADNKIDKVSGITAEVLEINGDWLKITYTKNGSVITGYIFNDSDWVEVITYEPDDTFEAELKAFPESYHDALQTLHAAYPNWKFIADNVDLTFKEAVELQNSIDRKLVALSQPISWRSMYKGSYDWSKNIWMNADGSYTGASREIISYYMDPRNFLNSSEIFQFFQQGYNADTQTEDGLKKIIAGTFLETGYTDPDDTAYGGSYIKVIMEAAKQSGVSAYVIAGKIIQEQGVNGTSALISGTYSETYKNCYNFFNVQATGNTNAEVIINGLQYAKDNGWTSRSAAIIGGAKFLADGYISVGQDTYYYQDFNVHNPDKIWHQYARAIYDARSKGVNLADTYATDKNSICEFKIPVYSNMPDTAAEKPASSDKKNNYYFSEISVSGLTPSFNMYTFSYGLTVTGDTTIKYAVPTGASLASATSYSLKQGLNNIVLTVMAETGYTTDYTISVNASKACTLYITTDGKIPDSGTTDEPDPPITPTVKKGDVNGDGKISISDIGNIRLHLLGRYIIEGDYADAADVNNDGKISISDIGNIRLHLLGRYTIEGW